MIFFLHGPEDFLTKKKTKLIQKKFIEKNPAAKVDVFDFEKDSDEADLFQSFRSGAGLFGGKKMIVLKNSFKLDEKSQVKILGALKIIFDSKETAVVFSEGEIKTKSNKLFLFLNKNSKVQESKRLDTRKAAAWLGSEMAARSGGKIAINISAQSRLVQITKNNLWKINSEIDKLIAFKLAQSGGNKTITLDDVNLLCQGEIEAKIFDLIDALGTRDKSKAIWLLKNVIDQGENEFYVFSMFLYQLRNLAVVAGFRDKFGADSQMISRQAGIHPFVAKKTLDQLRNFSKKQIGRLFGLAAKLDLEVKTGVRENMNDALVYFIAKS